MNEWGAVGYAKWEVVASGKDLAPKRYTMEEFLMSYNPPLRRVKIAPQPEKQEKRGGYGKHQVSGQKIRKWRKAHGWNQEEFADLAGLTRPTVSNIERGFPARVCDRTYENLVAILGEEITGCQ